MSSKFSDEKSTDAAQQHYEQELIKFLEASHPPVIRDNNEAKLAAKSDEIILTNRQYELLFKITENMREVKPIEVFTPAINTINKLFKSKSEYKLDREAIKEAYDVVMKRCGDEAPQNRLSRPEHDLCRDLGELLSEANSHIIAPAKTISQQSNITGSSSNTGLNLQT